jgi:hypothetical protein
MTPEQQRDLFGTIVEFFYPPYVLLPLWPFLWMPFEAVRWLAGALLALSVVASALLWWHLSGGSRRRWPMLAVGAGALHFYPTLDLISLQQLTGLVLLYLTSAVVLAARGHHAWAGVLLALAMIKPQAAALPVVWLSLWALSRRERWNLVLGFMVAMAGQLALAEVLVPGWVGEFATATGRYQAYNRSGYWLPALITGDSVLAGTLLIVLPVAVALIWLWWHHRLAPLTGQAGLGTSAATMAAVFVLLPDISFYNKTFLLLPLVTLAARVKATQMWQRLLWRVTWGLILLPYPAMAAGAVIVWHQYLAARPASTGLRATLSLIGHVQEGTYGVMPLVVTVALLAYMFHRRQDELPSAQSSAPRIGD